MLFSHIIKDKYLRIVGGMSLLILLLAIMIFYATLGSITTPLIIHFDSYRGIDIVGGRAEVYAILILGLILILINLFLAEFIYKRERFLSYIFAFASLLISTLILMAISVIISVN